MGKGKGSYNHEGNIMFRSLVKSLKVTFNCPNDHSRIPNTSFQLTQHQYLACKKNDKKYVAQSIINTIKSKDPPGRFLEYQPNSDSWTEIDDKRALEKTCQRLRKKQGDENEIVVQSLISGSIETEQNKILQQKA